MPSQSGFNGFPSTGVPANGELKVNDIGYMINGFNSKPGLLNHIEEMFVTMLEKYNYVNKNKYIKCCCCQFCDWVKKLLYFKFNLIYYKF